MIRRCAAPFCRTTLTDEDTIHCPHQLPFCEHCTWEDGCDDCDMYARAGVIWDAAADNEPPRMTAAEEAAGVWGELRRDDDAYELAHLEDREERRSA